MSEHSGITVEVRGPNTWAVQGGQGDDELTTFTLLDGPGIPGVVAASSWPLEARYSVPAPGAPQCEADGVRNGPDGPGGTEHYWTCCAPGTVDVDGTLMCDDHAGERGYGPKQEEYGYDRGAT